MQRRPLTIPQSEFNFVSPFERMFLINGAAARSYYQYTVNPMFTARSFDDALHNLGFFRPLQFDKKGQAHHPKTPPQNAHPQCYLKWGMEKCRHNHAVLEIGELYYLVHVDLKKTDAVHGGWHVDQMIIRNGRNEYYIPCEGAEVRFLGEMLLDCVRGTVLDLNAGSMPLWEATRKFQNGLQGVLDAADKIAVPVDLDMDIGEKMPSNRFPFTP